MRHHASIIPPKENGFTLIELLLVMAIAIILLSVSTINLIQAQGNTTLAAAKDVLAADMKSQQMKAIDGHAIDATTNDSYGIIFQSNKYTLFHGTTYDPTDTKNFTVVFDGPLTVTSTFPNDTIIFSRLTGEILNYSSSQNTITVTNTPDGKQHNLILNRLGVIIN